MNWIDLRKQEPEKGRRILVCDENGYVAIDIVEDVNNFSVGEMTWRQSWEFGNGTKLVAWMPLPVWPAHLCNKYADGEIP